MPDTTPSEPVTPSPAPPAVSTGAPPAVSTGAAQDDPAPVPPLPPEPGSTPPTTPPAEPDPAGTDVDERLTHAEARDVLERFGQLETAVTDALTRVLGVAPPVDTTTPDDPAQPPADPAKPNPAPPVEHEQRPQPRGRLARAYFGGNR